MKHVELTEQNYRNYMDYVADVEDLQIVETTGAWNSYPENLNFALIGFKNFKHFEAVKLKYPALNSRMLFKKEGWKLWSRRDAFLNEPIDLYADADKDGYRVWKKDEKDYFIDFQIDEELLGGKFAQISYDFADDYDFAEKLFKGCSWNEIPQKLKDFIEKEERKGDEDEDYDKIAEAKDFYDEILDWWKGKSKIAEEFFKISDTEVILEYYDNCDFGTFEVVESEPVGWYYDTSYYSYALELYDDFPYNVEVPDEYEWLY